MENTSSMLNDVTTSFSTHWTTTQDPNVEVLYRAASILEAYIQPLIVFLGVVGNVISFMILSLPNYKNSSTCVYMKGMAIADSMYLLFYVLQRTFISIFNTEIRLLDNFKWLCNQFLFWSYYAGLASSIILTTMSLDRLFALLSPLKARVYCSAKNARRFVISLFVFLLVILLPSNLSREFRKDLSGWLCPFHFDRKYAAAYDHFIAIVGTYLPLVCIFLSNVGIIFVLVISEKARRELSADSKTTNNKQVISMLLVVSFSFLILQLPPKVRNSFWQYYTGEMTPLIVGYRRLTVTLTDVILYCFYAFNTYLYIIPVKKFRQDVKTVCCCGKV